jgi:CheY-like chemotaxis protein
VECRRKILIVEDNPGDVRLMREALREIDPPVTLEIAADADDALAFLIKQKENGGGFPGLIFLDFNLPKAGSRDLLRQLKNDESLRMIPIAVLTTSDAERDIRDAYELHANCYLRKPVDLDGFLTTIRLAANFWLKVARASANISGGAAR